MRNISGGFLFMFLVLSAGAASAAEESRVKVYVKEFAGEGDTYGWRLAIAVRDQLRNTKCCSIIESEQQQDQAQLFIEGSYKILEADDMFTIIPYLGSVDFFLRDAAGKEIFKGTVTHPPETAFENDDDYWIFDTSSEIVRQIIAELERGGYLKVQSQAAEPQPAKPQFPNAQPKRQPVRNKYEYR